MTRPLFKTSFLTSLLVFLSLIAPLTAHALNGIPDTLSVGGKQLVLNGAGTRTKFIISVYNMGLYLPKKSSNAQQIMSANEPQAIRLKILSGFASKEKMKHALLTGFKNSTAGKTAPIQKEINQLLNAAFASNVNKGDVFEMAYTPSGGTKVSKNGKGLTVVKGLPFKQALIGIWLSNRPAQGSLKKQLLGK